MEGRLVSLNRCVFINVRKRLFERFPNGRLIVLHAEKIIFAEFIQDFQQRSSHKSGIAREQLNKRIFLEKVFGVLPKTRLFIGLVFGNGILGENEVEIVNKQIEQMDRIANEDQESNAENL